jgi:hypothetical protein
MVHLVAQTEENRANVIARVKRYFRNSKNWEHIKRLDTEHFANEVLCFRDISRLPDVQAELETFLKDQIVKLPEIEAPPASAKGRIFPYLAVLVGAVALVAGIAWAKREEDKQARTAEENSLRRARGHIQDLTQDDIKKRAASALAHWQYFRFK